MDTDKKFPLSRKELIDTAVEERAAKGGKEASPKKAAAVHTPPKPATTAASPTKTANEAARLRRLFYGEETEAEKCVLLNIKFPRALETVKHSDVKRAINLYLDLRRGSFAGICRDTRYGGFSTLCTEKGWRSWRRKRGQWMPRRCTAGGWAEQSAQHRKGLQGRERRGLAYTQ